MVRIPSIYTVCEYHIEKKITGWTAFIVLYTRTPRVHPRVFMGFVLLIFLPSCVVLLCVLLWCPLRCPHKRCSFRLSPSLFCRMGGCACLVIVMSIILSYRVFLCSEMRYDFHIKTLFGSSALRSLVCRRAHVLFMLLMFVPYLVSNTSWQCE